MYWHKNILKSLFLLNYLLTKSHFLLKKDTFVQNLNLKPNTVMRKKLQLVATIAAFTFSMQGYAQRYYNEVFTSVTKTSNVIYSNNISVITGTPTPMDITMDVYEPTGDTDTARPLVLVLHTGSFLPAVYNGQPTGSKSDSAVVEMCMRFAKKGYVAVAPDYRLGWNPVSTLQDVRTKTLLQAVYRSIQDAKACVRYFKKDKATANAYKIDTTRIAVGGLGSGGYIALAYATLNAPGEITIGKFIDNTTTPPTPYVDQAIFGNYDGTDATALNLPNHVGYGSDINIAFNIGGAIGDMSWLEAGEVPIVSFQCTNDPNAPYTNGAVIVPSTGDFVVLANGSYDVQEKVDSLNNNAIFTNASNISNPFTTQANLINNGYDGLYPFITPAPGANMSCTGAAANAQTEQGAPWDWWDGTAYAAATGHPSNNGTPIPGAVMACLALTGNPDMSAAKGRLYIDTIQGYLTPRLACALYLPGSNCVNTTGISEVAALDNTVTIFPNPATSTITVAVKGNTIETVELFDLTGRMVKQVAGVNAAQYTVQRDNLTSGLYFAKVKLNKGGVVTKRIVLE